MIKRITFSINHFTQVIRTTSMFAGVVLFTTLALVACGGGGGGDGGGGNGGGGQQPPPNPVPPPESTGVAPYGDFSATLAAGVQTTYSFEMALTPFDSESGEPASLTGLITTGVDLPLGRQTYSLDSLTCALPNGTVVPYSVLALFDRSGSIGEKDLGDQTLAAARTFIDRMTGADEGMVAAFPRSLANNRPGNPVTFYNADFTSDPDELLTAVSSVGAPDGETPLWDSAQLSLDKFGTASGKKALLVFTDGEDTDSKDSSPATVIAAALAGAVEVYSINLLNSNSQELDSIALATGGSVFSTDDVQALATFYENLGKLLSEQVVSCQVGMTVSIEPAQGLGEVAYGPAITLKTTLLFDADSPSGEIVVESEIDLPFAPGLKVGQTTGGASVFDSDVRDDDDNITACLELQGGALTNDCAEPVWAAICDAANPNTCQRGVLQAGDSLPAYANSEYAGCPWREPYRIYEALEVQGAVPSAVFTSWSGGGTDAACVYSARGPF